MVKDYRRFIYFTFVTLFYYRYAQRGTEMELETIQANLKLFAEFDSMLAFTLDTSDLRIRVSTCNTTHSTNSTWLQSICTR